MSNYAEKYPKGALSNSMLDAWESCPFKARVLYEERHVLQEKYDRILDAMSLGILVHSIIEEHSAIQIKDPVSWVFSTFEAYDMQTSYWIFDYLEAVRRTYFDGYKQGKEYKAAPGSEYWSKIGYWAKNYKHLDAEKEAFNLRIKLENNWLCDIEPVDFVLRAVRCLENYNKLLPQINPSAKAVAEQSFIFDFNGDPQVGTFDLYDLPEKGFVITDWKTGNKEYTPSIVQNLNQLNRYLLASKETGLLPENIDWDDITFRIVALERCEIIEAKATKEAYEKYIERLRRQIKYVKIMRQVPLEDLPVLAGKSLSIGCPCPLARIEGQYKCNLV